MLPRRSLPRGLTLVELMVVVAVLGVLIALVAPSFSDFFVMQRLRGVAAQLVTDLQFARSEAAQRGNIVRVNLGSNLSQTCYVIYTSPSNATRCECTRGAGNACTVGDGTVEVRTVNVERSGKVAFSWPVAQDTGFGFDPVTGGLISIPSDVASSPLALVQIDTSVDADRSLRTNLIQTGRPSVCAPNSARMQVSAC